MAQQASWRERTISTREDTVSLDSLSIEPSSFKVIDVDSNAYRLDAANAQLIWLNPPALDSVQVKYRVLLFDFKRVVQRKDTAIIEQGVVLSKNPYRYKVGSAPTNTFKFSQLQKQGSISRGLNFGNNQNLGVNSNLNLQLSGNISQRVQILAAISDNNIPIQPDGNTQQLQDFDQVYIQLFDKNNRLTVGDYQIKDPESYFLRYNKRLRGGNFETRFPLKSADSATMYAQASAAISRGKFARNIIQGVEGNQGPYRLTGEENENFIIVLSGTERVYIDGRLLERGQNNDYVIDYNQAEITFTARQLITKDKRIIVEFQYTAQSYTRSLIQGAWGIQKKKWNLHFNAYSEQDAKNQPLQQDLTEDQIAVLNRIGDNLDNAVASSVQEVGFANDRVLYKLRQDTLPSGAIDSIFIYSSDPDSAIYQVTFTDVGPANGNYIQVQSSANGQVYEYIAPVNGNPQGRYAPIVVLVTPKLRQLFTASGGVHIGRNTQLEFEGALSQNDLNTFSDRDNGDDVGYGFKTRLKTNRALGKKPQPWMLTGGFDYEFVNEDFERIERFRDVEFDRDWNIRDLNLTESQHLPAVQLGLQQADAGFIRYQFKGFLSESEYNATQQQVQTDLTIGSHELDYIGSYLNTTGNLTESEFFRHKTLYKKRFKHFNLGYRDDLENNLRRNPKTDSLSSAAYRFWEYEFFIETADSLDNFYKLLYNQRWDYGMEENAIRAATRGESAAFEFELRKNPNSRLKGKLAYRELQVLNDSLYSGDPENTVLGRIEYNLRLLKGAVTSTSFYEVSSGLEERQEFVYIEVAPGQGIYSWTDYNDNSIKELDEFEVAAFQDQANYLRVFTRTNEFVRVYGNQFNQSFFFRPVVLWSGASGWKKLVARFSDQVAYRVERKTNREEELERFNPFSAAIQDSNLISINSSFRNTLFFNRTGKTFGVEHTFQRLSNKSLQSNGFEGRAQRFQKINARFNFNTVYQLNIEAEEGTTQNNSEFFTQRNFNINYAEIQPKFTYQPNTAFNVAVAYGITEKENLPDLGGETAELQNATLSLQWNQIGKSSLTASASFIQTNFSGSAGNALAFEMLEGLQPGNNGTWEVLLQKNLGEFLQLNINYNGRISETAPVIHAGGVQLRAFF